MKCIVVPCFVPWAQVYKGIIVKLSNLTCWSGCWELSKAPVLCNWTATVLTILATRKWIWADYEEMSDSFAVNKCMIIVPWSRKISVTYDWQNTHKGHIYLSLCPLHETYSVLVIKCVCLILCGFALCFILLHM